MVLQHSQILEILLLSISICKARRKVKVITVTWRATISCTANNTMSFADKNAINTINMGLHLSDRLKKKKKKRQHTSQKTIWNTGNQFASSLQATAPQSLWFCLRRGPYSPHVQHSTGSSTTVTRFSIKLSDQRVHEKKRPACTHPLHITDIIYTSLARHSEEYSYLQKSLH